MWIPNGASYHQFLSDSVPTALCGLSRPKHAEAQAYVTYEKQCRICRGVWLIVCTSVDDARYSVARETNLRVLKISLAVSEKKTLTEMLRRRIHQVEMVKENA